MSIPCDRKAELLVIGALLLGGTETCRQAATSITPEDFSDHLTAAAWAVICALLDDGEPVRLDTFGLRWPRLVRQPPQAPPEILLAPDGVGNEAELPIFVAALKRAAMRRRAWAAATALMNASGDNRRDIGQAVASAITALQADGGNCQVEALGGREAAMSLTADLEARLALQGALTGIPTGFADLDKLTDGLQPQELAILGARPSMGKTALALGLAAHAAFRENVPTLFVSLEMSTAAILRRLAAMEAKVPLKGLRAGVLTPPNFPALISFNARLSKAPIWFLDAVSGTSVGRVMSSVRQHVAEHGVRLVVVDYLQKIRGDERFEKKTYEVASVSSALKGLAVTQNIHVLAAAQLNREPERDKGRSPRLSDLADSGQIERDADLIALLARHSTDKDPTGASATLLVGKQRDGETGLVHLTFNGPYCRFENAAKPELDDVPL
jgi:replicative DNA helicase